MLLQMKSVRMSEINGRIAARPSKSVMQRVLAASLLAPGRSRIRNPSFCRDSEAALNAARTLGAKVTKTPELVTIDGGLSPNRQEIHCGEAGLTLRMFTPIAALFDKPIKMIARGTLRRRPMDGIQEVLTSLGCSCTVNGNHPPLTVTGPMRGGCCEIDGSLTSQFLSGLLFALPLTPAGGCIRVTNPQSLPYIDLTLETLSAFGIQVANQDYRLFRVRPNQVYSPAEVAVEGDWSSASFFLVAAALAGRIEMSGLNPASRQADKGITAALEMCGAQVKWTGGILGVRKSKLRGFTFDATQSPDLFPPLVALALNCYSISRISGVRRLRHKESDRGRVLLEEFKHLGARMKIENDSLIIEGGKIHGGVVNSRHDHRIAMAAACAGLKTKKPVTIVGSECVAKSHPGFFSDLAALGGRVQ
ncbi:MAG TPA: 3-phosphoshikimate 1-carboxyvinyltransferase [Candidatus Aminicenantes bacterium]|nr:3-phosphoshikimate 1-carboxyvinyltransferase [Candidatus Aminicenantes bacterium]